MVLPRSSSLFPPQLSLFCGGFISRRDLHASLCTMGRKRRTSHEPVSYTDLDVYKRQGYLRRELGAALQLRYTPELVFEADDSIAHGTHILEVLRGIEEKEGLLEEGDETP